MKAEEVITTTEEMRQLRKRRQDRRAFFRQIGGTGFALVGASFITGNQRASGQSTSGSSCLTFPPNQPTNATTTDVDLLNFALNLEYLEAEFYTVATTGKTLQESNIDTGGGNAPTPTTGGKQVDLGVVALVAQEIAQDEQKHVEFLRAALGSAAVAKPAINLNALGVGFNNVQEFITVARAFEDVGVSAYGGAAALLTDKNILASAARIALTEALHAGLIRIVVDALQIRVPYVDSRDVPPPPAGSSFFAVDSNALAIVRTPSQVLSIVYANNTAGTSSGGFFPNGLNGTIRSV